MTPEPCLLLQVRPQGASFPVKVQLPLPRSFGFPPRSHTCLHCSLGAGIGGHLQEVVDADLVPLRPKAIRSAHLEVWRQGLFAQPATALRVSLSCSLPTSASGSPLSAERIGSDDPTGSPQLCHCTKHSCSFHRIPGRDLESVKPQFAQYYLHFLSKDFLSAKMGLMISPFKEDY